VVLECWKVVDIVVEDWWLEKYFVDVVVEDWWLEKYFVDVFVEDWRLNMCC